MKKIFKLFLAVLLIVSLSVGLHTDIFAEEENIQPDKLETALWEYMQTADDNELIPIYLSLYPIDDAVWMDKVKSKTGMDPKVYMDEDRFQAEVANKITAVLEKKLGYEEAHKVGNDASEEKVFSDQTEAALRAAFSGELKSVSVDADNIIEFVRADRSLSIVDYTILMVRKNFQAEKNKAIGEVQTAENELFVQTYVNPRNNEVTQINSFASMFLNVKKSDILYYAQLAEVASIYYDDPIQFEDALAYVSEQVGADSTTGTKSPDFNNGSGFKGTGISIGIIEAGGVCDTTSPHFDSSRMHIVSNGSVALPISTHASLVTAIAAGERVGLGGYVYTGIVPEAEVYCTRVISSKTFSDALSALNAIGVDVINLSICSSSNGYSEDDRILDDFINSFGITCVVAAGNLGEVDGAITSPGYALNCITVGNLRTKSSGSNIIGLRPYALHSTSSWQEPNALPNKPDVCAPGTWVRAVRTTTGSNNFYYDLEYLDNPLNMPTGTSCSAPIVTGIVAQMMQQHSAKIGKPQAVKAKLMNTANPNIVTTADNPTEDNKFLREKSGAGMVSATKAMSGHAYKYAWNHNAVESDYITQFTVNLSVGQTLRASLAFSNKNTQTVIQNNSQYYNMDLRIIDASTGESLCDALGDRNNVEIVEYTATANCTVYIQTRIVRNVVNIKTDWALEVDRY